MSQTTGDKWLPPNEQSMRKVFPCLMSSCERGKCQAEYEAIILYIAKQSGRRQVYIAHVRTRRHIILSSGRWIRMWWVPILGMMTSTNERIFRVTGPLCGDFSAQRPVMRSFVIFFDLRLNKRLSKRSRGWWFETSSRSLWRHCNGKRYLLILPTKARLLLTMISSYLAYGVY